MTARGNDARTGRAANETVITKSSIGKLAPVWSAPGQSVDGTEAIVNGAAVYVVTTDATTDVSEGDFDSNGGGTPGIDGRAAAWASYKFTGTAPVPPSTANPVPTPEITGNGFATPLIVGGRVYAGYSASSVPPGSNPPVTALSV